MSYHTVNIKYGLKTLKLNLPKNVKLTTLKTPKTIEIKNLKNHLTKQLNNPIGSAPFKSFFKKHDKILFLVPDITRYVAAKKTLPIILSKLKKLGLSSNNFSILFANGIHRKLSSSEIKQILGEKIIRSIPAFNHDAYDKNSLIYLGKTRHKTPIYINKKIFDFDKIISLSGINFHYFAGFSGGRKMLIPGISGKETCFNNHKLIFSPPYANFRNIYCKPGNLNKNPIHLDMVEMCKKVKLPIFSINVILNENKDITYINCGDILKAHIAACNHFSKVYKLKLSEKFDLAIVSPGGFPKDINMIQSHKALEHIQHAISSKGTIVLVAECRDGLGHCDFYPWFKYKNLKIFYKRLVSNYNIYGQTAFCFSTKAKKYNLYIMSSLSKNVILKIGANSIPNMQSIQKLAIKSKKILFAPCGGITLPA